MPRILDRQRRLIGERLHEPKVVLGEQPAVLAAVQVDRADHPSARAERHAHQRVDLVEAHAGEIAEALVASGIDGEERPPGAGGLDDAAAERLGVPHRLALEVPHQVDRELPRPGPVRSSLRKIIPRSASTARSARSRIVSRRPSASGSEFSTRIMS